MEAAKWDGRLSSREGAADLLGMSVSALADAELELSKCMPPDKAVRMAELYNAPHLLNYYCLKQCPIGKNKPLSEDVLPIERVTVKLFYDATENPYCGYITLDKRTETGLYDPWSGGGSVFEIQLEKDVHLPIRFIRSALPDGGDGRYSVKSVYGMCSSVWRPEMVKEIHLLQKV